MTLKDLILKLQELDKKYEQYSKDTEVVIAVHSKNEYNPEVSLDYIDEVLHPAWRNRGRRLNDSRGDFSSLPFFM